MKAKYVKWKVVKARVVVGKKVVKVREVVGKKVVMEVKEVVPF